MARIVSLRSLFLAVLLVGSCLEGVHAYNDLLSVPRNYRKGEHIEFKVNQLRSNHGPPMTDSYLLPLCRPKEAVMYDPHHAQATSSPYSITMLQDVYCAKLCVANLGHPDAPYARSNSITRVTRDKYHQNWLIDGLPAAMKQEDHSTRTRYWGGIPVGFVGSDGAAYINNHMNFEIYYRPDEGTVDAYHVVRVIVQPLSIRHEFEMRDETIVATERTPLAQEDANITNPIKSCNRKSPYSYHTDYDMVKDHRGNASLKGQPTSGLVLFTYDVIWKEDSSLSWSRWDVYLTMDFHWTRIIVGTVFASILLLTIVLAPIRHLRREISRFKRDGCEQEGYGWTLLHGDVFRPPAFCPDWLAIAAGSGAHLLATFLLVMCSACSDESLVRTELGSGDSIAYAGESFILGILLIYAMLGCVGGYVTVFFCRIFGCDDTSRATWITSLGFPGLCLFGAPMITIYVVLACFGGSLMVFCNKSDRAWIALACGSLLFGSVILLGMMASLLFPGLIFLWFLWLVVLVPSCHAGAWLGLRRRALSFPVIFNAEPRKIPNQTWLLRLYAVTVLSGCAGYHVMMGAEYASVMSSSFGWLHAYSCRYSFVVAILVILVTAEMTILGTYLQLNQQDYQWWWRSFYTGGATAFFLFAYSWVFLSHMDLHSFWEVVCATWWTTMICLGVFLALGFVGLVTSLLFARYLYGSIPWSMDVVDVVVEAGAPEVVKLGGQHQHHSVAGDDSESSVVVVYHLVKKARYRHPKHNTSQTNSLA